MNIFLYKTNYYDKAYNVGFSGTTRGLKIAYSAVCFQWRHHKIIAFENELSPS
jgi:hypothetical protein